MHSSSDVDALVEENADEKAQIFLTMPSLGTLVIEVSCSNDHASYLYKVAAAAEGLQSVGGRILRISSNGMIIHDCDESLKDMGYKVVPLAHYDYLKRDSEELQELKNSFHGLQTTSDKLREELEKERAKNAALQGELDLSFDELRRENHELKEKLKELGSNDDYLTLVEVRNLLQRDRGGTSLTFDKIRDKDEESIRMEVEDLYCELREKNDLLKVQNISRLKSADRFDHFKFLIEKWLEAPKPECMRGLSAHSIKEKLELKKTEVLEDFKQFCSKLKKFDVHGYRAVWARNLGIEDLLIDVLPIGFVLDRLKGFREMKDEELMKACREFFKKFCVMIFREHAREQQRSPESNVISSGATNDKFLSEMKFAKLDDFYSGPEARIGIPNPNLYAGMWEEHCKRPTKDIPILTSNYGLFTTSEIEWYWIVDPESVLIDTKTRKYFLSQNKDDTPAAKPKYLFPGEVGQKISELLVDVTYGIKDLGVDYSKQVEEDILERFRLVFMPKSKIWTRLYPNDDEIAKYTLLRDISKVETLSNLHSTDSKTLCIALSFTRTLELPDTWGEETRKMLHVSRILYLLDDIKLQVDDAENNKEMKTSASQFSIKVVFEAKAHIFQHIQAEVGGCCSKFIQDIVHVRLFDLFAELNMGSPSPHADSDQLKAPPYLKDKTIKQLMSKGNQRLELSVLKGPEVQHAKDVAMHFLVLFEREGAAPDYETIRNKIETNWIKKFKRQEIGEDVAIHDLHVTGKRMIEYCENVENINLSVQNQNSPPQLKLNEVNANTIETLSKRLNEQKESISDLLKILKMKRDQRIRRHGRAREKLDSFVDKVLGKTTAKNCHGLLSLVMDEILALRLYTGPMYVVYNALLRSFPLNLFARFGANRFASTIFSIISGITKLSRFAQIPDNRKVYRGLSGVTPPEDWIVSKNAEALVGVEFGLQSTTDDIDQAIKYTQHSDNKPRRPIIFEIDVGKIDIGASLHCISQYPHEKEFLMPPLSCLEVVDQDIRLHKGKEIHVYQLKLNVNLKLSTAEDLMTRRRRFYFDYLHLLRTSLETEMRHKSEEDQRQFLQRRKFMPIRGDPNMVKTEFTEDDFKIEFKGNGWTTVGAHRMSVKSGKKCFAIKINKLVENSILCIGFACINFRLGLNTNDCKDSPLGMDSISWAVSSDNGKKGFRGQWDTIKDKTINEPWKEDQVIGLALDVDEGNMYLIRNNVFDKGRPIFTNVRFSLEGGNSIFPAISCSGGCELEYMCERCDYDERKDFKFQPPDGYEFIFQHRKLGDVKYEDQNYIEKLYTLKVDHHQIMLKFDRETMEMNQDLSPEVFNDVTTFKKLLCEACDIRSQLQNKQATIIMMCEAKAPDWLCTELSEQEPGEFRVHLGNEFLQENCQMTWDDVLFPLRVYNPMVEAGAAFERKNSNPDNFEDLTPTLRKKFKNFSIPLELPANLAKYMWMSILRLGQYKELGGSEISVKIGEHRLNINTIYGSLVLNPSPPQVETRLVSANYESVVTEFIRAASEEKRVLKSLDITKHQYSKKGILDLVKAASKVYELETFNGCYVKEIEMEDRMAVFSAIELSISEHEVEPYTVVFNITSSNDDIPIFADIFSFRKQNEKFNLKEICEDLSRSQAPDSEKYCRILCLLMASRLEALKLKSLNLDLSEFSLTESLMSGLFNHELRLGNIKDLSLKLSPDNGQVSKAFDPVFSTLGSLSELQSLDLSNGISLGTTSNNDSNSIQLLSTITTLTKLEKLKLRGTELGQNQKVWEHAASTFTILKSLKLLDLSDNWLGKIDPNQLINAFTRLSGLSELNLKNNNIESKKCVELVKALVGKVDKENPEEGAPRSVISLTSLTNPIDQDDKMQLQDMIANKKLREPEIFKLGM